MLVEEELFVVVPMTRSNIPPSINKALSPRAPALKEKRLIEVSTSDEKTVDSILILQRLREKKSEGTPKFVPSFV